MLESGAKAPDFALADTEGKPWKLSDAIQSGPVLLAFYKISCPTCQFTLPFLNRIADGGMQIVGISQDDAKHTRGFKQEFGASLLTLLDAEPGYPVSNAYKITHVPSLFVVGTDGKISKAFNGFSKADLEGLGVSFGAEPVPALRPG